MEIVFGRRAGGYQFDVSTWLTAFFRGRYQTCIFLRQNDAASICTSHNEKINDIDPSEGFPWECCSLPLDSAVFSPNSFYISPPLRPRTGTRLHSLVMQQRSFQATCNAFLLVSIVVCGRFLGSIQHGCTSYARQQRKNHKRRVLKKTPSFSHAPRESDGHVLIYTRQALLVMFREGN